MAFRPKVADSIQIDGHTYHFTEHPSAKGMPYGQTGRRATVYQLKDESGAFYALKVFTLAFRSEQTKEQAIQIARFDKLPGLKACKRIVLSNQNNQDLLQQYPDLKFSVLMPWVEGLTWQEIILSRKPVDEKTSLHIAKSLLELLTNMEKTGIAHCDLSAPNILLNINSTNGHNPISLIDLEDLYAPGLNPPPKLPGGSAGYAHSTSSNGIWSLEADRFSGAVLIAEMLGWCDERVRRIACGEQFFDPAEMQQGTDRFILLKQVLYERFGERVANTFSEAWFSTSLSSSPSFMKWNNAINPPPNPNELFSQILRVERIGRWMDVISLCDEILNLQSNNMDVWPIRARAKKLQTLDVEIQGAWTNANNSGLTCDWELCLKKINSAKLLAPQTIKYQAQCEQAEHELEQALKIDDVESFVHSRKWKEAENLLREITPIQPRYTEIRSTIDSLHQHLSKLKELKEAANQLLKEGDWQSALEKIEIIEKVEPLDGELQNIKGKAQILGKDFYEYQKRFSEAEQNYSDGHFEEARKQIIEALKIFPNQTDAKSFLSKIEIANEQRKKLDKAYDLMNSDQLDEAIKCLESLPECEGDLSSVRKKILERIRWRISLRNARSGWQLTEVIALLNNLPDGEADQPLLRAEFQKIIENEVLLRDAELINDYNLIISTLEKLPSNYPGLNVRIAQAKQKLELQNNIAQGLKTFDLESIEDILVQLPINDPRSLNLQKWVMAEKERRQVVLNIQKNFDVQEAQKILINLPEDYPQKALLARWINDEHRIRNTIDELVDQYDLPSVNNLLQQFDENHPLRIILNDWLEKEYTRRERIKLAQVLFDGESLLELLQDLQDSYPGKNELINWAASEISLQKEIRKAMQSHRHDQAKEMISRIEKNHPYYEEFIEWLGL